MKRFAIIFALLSGVLYAISITLSKLLLEGISPTLLAGFLYLGAGLGMGIIFICTQFKKKKFDEKLLDRKDGLYVFLMVVLDIAAPILMLFGLSLSSSYSASLITNFEIVATALVALVIFKEKIGKYTWIGIVFITVASILLSLDFSSSISFSWGSFLILLACIVWGVENNCTKMISSKNPLQIVTIKGIFAGIGSLAIGFIIQEKVSNFIYIFYALILGFASFGLSVFFYVIAQRYLGAAKVGAYYSVNPFIGSLLSFIIFQTIPFYTFYIAFGLMVIGLIFISIRPKKKKVDLDIITN